MQILQAQVWTTNTGKGSMFSTTELFFWLGTVSSLWSRHGPWCLNLAALQAVQSHSPWLGLAGSWGLCTKLWAEGGLFSFFATCLWLVLSKYLYISSECCNGHLKSIWPVTHDYFLMVLSVMWAGSVMLFKMDLSGQENTLGHLFLSAWGSR